MKKLVSWGKSVFGVFLSSNCSLHAAGLTYFTLLALVPVLCLVLFFAKQAGVDRYAREFINGKIDAMIENVEHGQEDGVAEGLSSVKNESEEAREKKRIAAQEFAGQARKISDTLFRRIEQFNVKTLGWIGFAMLMWTVISTLTMVEGTFNHIWGVAKNRPVWKRAYMYLFIALVMPVLAGMAMSMPVLNVAKNVIISTLGATWLTKWVGDGLVYVLELSAFRFLVTFALTSFFFSFFLWLIPNCRVRKLPAVYAGMITAFLFGAWIRVCAVAQVGIANSSALYGSFAFLPIVLAWIYMSWQIVLLGACVTNAFQKLSES